MYKSPKAGRKQAEDHAVDRARRKSAWRDLMKSTTNAISRGAALINRIISFARGENWRGKKKKTTLRRHKTKHRGGKK